MEGLREGFCKALRKHPCLSHWEPVPSGVGRKAPGCVVLLLPLGSEHFPSPYFISLIPVRHMGQIKLHTVD